MKRSPVRTVEGSWSTAVRSKSISGLSVHSAAFSPALSCARRAFDCMIAMKDTSVGEERTSEIAVQGFGA